jgi:hypothetical protein
MNVVQLAKIQGSLDAFQIALIALIRTHPNPESFKTALGILSSAAQGAVNENILMEDSSLSIELTGSYLTELQAKLGSFLKAAKI